MEAYRTPTEEGQAIAAKNYANATSDAAARNDVWLEAIRQQQANTSETYNALSEIRRREEYDRIEKEANNRDMIESAIATTPDGGTLSPNQVKHINRLRGLNVDSGEIQNGQIMEGGWNPKTGGYGFVFAQTDGNGNVTYTPSEISPNEIYGMMKNRPEWFSEDRITSLGNLMRKNDGSLVDSDFDGFARNYLAGRSARKVSLENARARMGSGLSVDDRLAIEREKNKGKIDVENARGQNRFDVASANNKSRESIADKNNAAKLKIADIGAELKRLGFEVDEKKLAEAIRHNKANEATANSRVAETMRHNQVAEGQGQSRLDEAIRHNKANEAHQSAELDEKKRHAMTSEEIAKETVTLKKRMQDFKERMAKPQNNSITSNLPESVIASNKKKILEMEKIINNGGAMSEENFKLVNDRFNKLVSETFSGSPYEEKQSLEVPEGTRIPDGAITTEPAGYKVNNKTHMMVYYWLNANGERIYGDQIPMNR